MDSKDIDYHSKMDDVVGVAEQIGKLPIATFFPYLDAMKELIQFGKGLYEYRVARLVKIILTDVNKLSPDAWSNVIDELQDVDKKKRFGAAMYDILFETRRQADAEFFSFLLYKKVIGEITTDELIQMKNMTEKLNDIYSLKSSVKHFYENCPDNSFIKQTHGSIDYYSETQELYKSGAFILSTEAGFLGSSGEQFYPPLFAYSGIGKVFITQLAQFFID